ncbi:cysteine-rich secretory protein 2-like [Notolabrus celidotus]|uniref:cysteine-rich secretory protein 2-like n=1 Tax=Notolabrus celidotus TaxID=1203425 RepID=UPI00148F56CA|nr:cysteine-rich secretory protein 2-like [Notolabrus celidotus]
MKDGDNQVEGTVGVSPADEAEIVDKHNSLRRNVKPTASNMLKISWSSEAAANAQKWANTCSIKHSSAGQRKISTSGCGENLFLSTHKNSWSSAIQSWYDEVKDWQYGVGPIHGKEVGHFTQLDWYRSNHVGCGVAHCPGEKFNYFFVCQYCPPGNYQLATPFKKGPSCGDCPDSCEDRLCTNPCEYSDKYSNCQKLVKKYGCTHKTLVTGCPASCSCSDKII